jgi:hypothetical protein
LQLPKDLGQHVIELQQYTVVPESQYANPLVPSAL